MEPTGETSRGTATSSAAKLILDLFADIGGLTSAGTMTPRGACIIDIIDEEDIDREPAGSLATPLLESESDSLLIA